MPDDNDSKLNQILSELPEGKRRVLKDYIDGLAEDKKDDFIKEVITEYEAMKKKAQKATPKDPVKTESNEVSDEPVSEAKSEEVSFPDSDSSLPYPEDTQIDIEEEISKLDFSGTAKKAPVIKKGQPVNDIQDFTKTPLYADRRRKNPLPGILISLLALILAGGTVFVLLFSKDPKFAAITSKLGINVTTTQTETTVPVNSESVSVSKSSEKPSEDPTEDTKPSDTSETTKEPEKTEVPTPVPTTKPERAKVTKKSNAPNLKGIKVVIDPGHQQNTDYKKEPYKKGATTGKARCTSGTVGVSTKQKEYELTLDTALMLKDYLEQCGATVVMTRNENNVNLSNRQRAAIAVKAKPTLFIRLHADAGYNSKVKGVRVYIPKSGKYNKISNAKRLGKLVAKAGKTSFRGAKATNQYTGLNYATSIRSYQIVLGYLSNKADDERLADPNNRYEICAAIASFCATFKKK